MTLGQSDRGQDRMKRREFVALVGGALAWPLSGHAQEAAKPVVGFLSTRAPKDAFFIAPFREGLKEADLTEGENVLIECPD